MYLASLNKILFISGDGVDNSKKKLKLHYNYFPFFTKNYFICRALKTVVNNCEILNFSQRIWFLNLLFGLESIGIFGSSKIRSLIVNIIYLYINNIICRKIRNSDYDLIIFSDNLYFMNKKLLEKINNFSSGKLVLLSGVSPEYFLQQSEKDCVPYYDSIFINDPGHRSEWEDLGAQKVICLPISAGYPDIFHKIPLNQKNNEKYDIVFIGRLDTDTTNYRLEILYNLISSGIDIKIWTGFDIYHMKKTLDAIDKYPLLKKNILGSAYGEKMVSIYLQSKIILNLHHSSVPTGGNMRLFEIPTTRTLQIADKCPEDWFKNGHDIVLFNDQPDLLNKINYYLDNQSERDRIANNGFNRIKTAHTYKHRVDKMLNSL